MSGYTPTTDEIRNVWGEFSEYGGLTNRTSGGSLIDARYAEFDRWLATHDRDIQAQALREVAERILPYSGIGLANGATRSDVSAWLTDRAARLTATTEDRKTADEWCQLLGVKIIDSDGWRETGTAWNTPITEAEFHQRAARSTVTPLTKTAACKHCRRAIETTAPSKGWIHADGHNKHLGRCNSVDSGLPYGYNAEPMGEPCRAPCLGTTTTEETTT